MSGGHTQFEFQAAPELTPAERAELAALVVPIPGTRAHRLRALPGEYWTALARLAELEHAVTARRARTASRRSARMTEHDNDAVPPAATGNPCRCRYLWRKTDEGRDTLRRTVTADCPVHALDERDPR